jgi:hypothetical protein
VQIPVVRGIKGKKSNRMLPRKLAKNVIAADFSAGVGWNQSAGFNPENLHIADVLSAD